MIIEFDKVYKELICEEVPMKKLRSIEDRGGYINKNEKMCDPWDGEKPHAKDGFVEKYCLEY